MENTWQVSDLIADYKLQTEFDSGATTHTYYETTAAGHRQQVREVWTRQGMLGKGSWSTVWLESCQSGRQKHQLRAVKATFRSSSSHKKTIDFARTIEATLRLSQEKYVHCFVRAFGWFEDSDNVFIAMEYMPHGDLQRFIKQTEQPVPEDQVRDITYQIVEALSFLHGMGYAHRDLKPANILIQHPGPHWWVKLGDLALVGAPQDLAIGTMGYMAPEVMGMNPSIESQSIGSPTLAATDMWGLGATIHYILTGSQPFSDFRVQFEYISKGMPFPVKHFDAVRASSSCRDFVRKLMSADPNDRPTPQSAARHSWLNDGFVDPRTALPQETSTLQEEGPHPQSPVATWSTDSGEVAASAGWTTQSSSEDEAVNEPVQVGMQTRTSTMDQMEETVEDHNPAPAAVSSMTRCLEWAAEMLHDGSFSQEEFQALFGVSYNDFIAKDSKEPSENSDVEDGSNLVPWESLSEGNTTSLNSEAEKIDSKISPLHVQQYYVRTHLKSLTDLAVAIRKAGSRLRHQRADEALKKLLNNTVPPRSAEEYEEKSACSQLRRHLAQHIHLELSPFCRSAGNTFRLSGPEDNVVVNETSGAMLFSILRARLQVMEDQGVLSTSAKIIIETKVLDYSRLTKMQRHLIDANITRYFRLLHTRRKWKPKPKIKEKEPEKALDEAREPRHNQAGFIDSTLRRTMSEPAVEANTFADFISEPDRVDRLGTRINPAQPAPRQPSYMSFTPKSRATSITELPLDFKVPTGQDYEDADSTATPIAQALDYPDHHEMLTSEEYCVCPYCCLPLEESYREDVDAWRGHVAYDLKPYTCIFENCIDSAEFFTKRIDWIKHMENKHSVTRWICDECSKQSTEKTPLNQSFHSQAEWVLHMRLQHRDIAQNQDLTLQAPPSMRQTFERVACPLCPAGSGLLDISKDNHIAGHIHDFALMSLSLDEIDILDDRTIESTAIVSDMSEKSDTKTRSSRVPSTSSEDSDAPFQSPRAGPARLLERVTSLPPTLSLPIPTRSAKPSGDSESGDIDALDTWFSGYYDSESDDDDRGLTKELHTIVALRLKPQDVNENVWQWLNHGHFLKTIEDSPP